MKHRSANETRAVLEALDHAIKFRGKSLRSIGEETKNLDPPEKMVHPRLSIVLSGAKNSSLYLQQFFVLCGILKIPPIALLLRSDDLESSIAVALAAERLCKLDRAKRHHLIGLIEALEKSS